MENLKKVNLILLAGALLVGVITTTPSHAIVPGTNTLIDYNSTNTGVASASTNQNAHISEDGNMVAWLSNSWNVIPGDPYQYGGTLYVRNMQTGVAIRPAVDLNGAPVSVKTESFAMSRTGRYIVYTSIQSNIASSPALTGINRGHVYLVDTKLGLTTLVDQSSSGVLSNAPDNMMAYASGVSDDGRFVLFSSYANNLLSSGNPSNTNSLHYYVKDMLTGQVVNPAVSNTGARANSAINRVFMSCDGSILALSTNSTNLTPQDNGNFNVYLVDLRNGQNITNLTYNSNQGGSLMSLSCNARYLVLASLSTNLTVDLVTGSNGHYFRYDRLSDTYVLVDKSTSGYISSSHSPVSDFGRANRTVSDDGKVVFRSDDMNMISPSASRTREVYLSNPEAGTLELVPVNSSGVEQNQTGLRDTLEINARGTAVVYPSMSTNLVPGITSGIPSSPVGMLVLSKVE